MTWILTYTDSKRTYRRAFDSKERAVKVAEDYWKRGYDCVEIRPLKIGAQI